MVPTSMVMEEMEKPRETHVLGRGDYRNRGEKVLPGVPSSLPPLPAGAPQTASVWPAGCAILPTRSPRALLSIAIGRCISATAS